MAANLQRHLRASATSLHADPCLRIYNRTPAKAHALASDPQMRCMALPSAADVATSCSIVCIMLSDDTACETVLQQVFTAWGAAPQEQGHLAAEPNTGAPAAAPGEQAGVGPLTSTHPQQPPPQQQQQLLFPRLVVNHSTCYPDLSREAAARAAAVGAVYVAAPVFGR